MFAQLGDPHQGARLRRRRSTPAPAPASRCSTTRASSGPASSRCPTGSGSPAGTARPTPAPPYIREDGWRPRRPDEAVPGRPQRDLGRRHDQHRPQLPRPRRRLRRRARGPLPAAPGSATGSTPRSPRHRRAADPGQGAAVPADRAGHLRRAGQRHVRRRHDRRGPRLAGRPQVHRRRTPSRRGTGRRCCPPERRTIVKCGSADESRPPAAARAQRGRRQRAVRASGVFDAKTEQALRAYQARVGIAVSGVATPPDLEQAPAGQVAAAVSRSGGPTSSATPVRAATATTPAGPRPAGGGAAASRPRARRAVGAVVARAATRRRAAPRRSAYASKSRVANGGTAAARPSTVRPSDQRWSIGDQDA